MQFNRRSFLKSTATVSCAGFGLFPKTNLLASEFLANDIFSRPPIKLLNAFEGSSEFSGDHEMAAHEIFWDKKGFLRKHGPIPSPSETYDVIVIGSGIGGLCSTYFNRNKKTLLLEGHPQVGGNSKAEKYKSLTMSQGAAYITLPEEGDPIDTFLSELGIKHKFRKEMAKDFTIGLNGKIAHDFWNGGSDIASAYEFQKVFNKFIDIYNNDYPELPCYPGEYDRSKLNELDILTFDQWIKKEIPSIHPHIYEFFHQYCWSSFGGSIEEISAAQAIGFIASDLAGIQTLPGGNAGIAQALYNEIKSSNARVQNDCFAVNVKVVGSHTEVTYFKNGKRLVTIKAKKVIMACPKLVAKHLIEDLDQDQHFAMNKIGYRAYLMVNILLKKKVSSLGYDIYALKNEVPTTGPREAINERGFCDVAFADWANYDNSNHSALTLYIPQPYEGANHFLFSPTAYEKHKARILSNIAPWLGSIGLGINDIHGMRMCRYGHALPVASSGKIASGVLEMAHRPIEEQIYFAHSDNWANPCFETAFYSALNL